jgi:hypothetical protein
MEHLVKLLRDSYDLQEEKSEETAYWHLQKLRSEIKQLTLTDVSQRSELLPDFLYKDDFGIKIGYHGDTEVSEEWNDYLKKLGNCG